MPRTSTPKKYKVKLTISNEELKSSSVSLEEAILAVKPEKISSKICISVEKDGKKSETYLMVARAKRIFTNPLAMFLFAKRMTLALK